MVLIKTVENKFRTSEYFCFGSLHQRKKEQLCRAAKTYKKKRNGKIMINPVYIKKKTDHDWTNLKRLIYFPQSIIYVKKCI